MARVYDNPYWTPLTSSDWRTTDNAIANKFKASGRYTEVHHFTGTQLDLTGSMLGYGPIIVAAGAFATASLRNGGRVNLGDVSTGVFYDFAVKKLTGATSQSVYVFKAE